MRTVAAGLLAALVIVSCQSTATFPGQVGSGTRAVEERAPGSFQEIRVEAAVNASVTIGSKYSVRVAADDNLLDNVITTVDGPRLEIAIRGGVQTRTPVEVTVVLPTLTAVEATSAGRVEVSGIEADRLAVAGDSAGSAVVTGRVDALDVHAGSAARLDLRGVEAGRADVQLDSSAHVWLNVAGDVRGSVTSAAVLTLAGEAENVGVSTSTAGRVVTE